MATSPRPDTYICERHRKTGYCIVRHKTTRKRMVAMRKAERQQLRQRHYESIAKTGRGLGSVVHGCLNYHAVPGNMHTLGLLRRRVIWFWRRQLPVFSAKKGGEHG